MQMIFFSKKKYFIYKIEDTYKKRAIINKTKRYKHLLRAKYRSLFVRQTKNYQKYQRIFLFINFLTQVLSFLVLDLFVYNLFDFSDFQDIYNFYHLQSLYNCIIYIMVFIVCAIFKTYIIFMTFLTHTIFKFILKNSQLFTDF